MFVVSVCVCDKLKKTGRITSTRRRKTEIEQL